AQLCVGALQSGLLALTAQRVLFDELVPRATVQTELQTATVLRKVQVVLWHADGEGQVAAYAPNDDGRADVTGLNLHMPAHSRATSLYNGQAAALTSTASTILKSQRQILSGGLVYLLICTAVVGLKDHSVFKSWIKQHCFITTSILLCIFHHFSNTGTVSICSVTDCDLYSS
uniref:Uncharacterized protein n=1 Tax=Lates calcarifer TaxID=8187 RepID=A0A4W6BYK8_LATCA